MTLRIALAACALLLPFQLACGGGGGGGTDDPTPAPSPEASAEPSPDPTDAPSPDPSQEPTPVASPEPSPQPSADPSQQPSPTPAPTPCPSPEPSAEPSPQPSPDPSPQPSPEPTPDPSPQPSPEPTPDPSPSPTPVTEPAILFAAQVPMRTDFGSSASTFNNHQASVRAAPRGGGLYIRYPDGTVRDLTADAGFGSPGEQQGADAIAVRDPAMHWDGEKAIFSMIVGAPSRQYEQIESYWQLYEITGLGADQTPVITRVPHQPERYNNINPIYGSDDRIIFVSDRPPSGDRRLYPALDEYESTAINTGLWRLDPQGGGLLHLDHSPSGDFTPFLDSFGRIIFTRWDHLQRDQQADGDINRCRGDEDTPSDCDNPPSQACTYPSEAHFDAGECESVVAAYLGGDLHNGEIFPEPRDTRDDILAPGEVGLRFNHFLPWMVAEDGTELESLNHIGRHELHAYMPASPSDDPQLSDHVRDRAFTAPDLHQLREDPNQPGRYCGTWAPEFATFASGRISCLSAPPQRSADDILPEHLTAPDTNDQPNANHPGTYRNPLWLRDGRLIAGYSPAPHTTQFRFRLHELTRAAGADYYTAGQALLGSGGIDKRVRYWSPDVEVVVDGPLWEMSPVEVRARPRPSAAPLHLPAPEQQIFTQAGVDQAQLRSYLRDNNLALVVSRDVTTRDDADRQQPYNLRISGTDTVSTGPGAPQDSIYDVRHIQFMQCDYVRGYGTRTGRRCIPRIMSDPAATGANPAPAANAPPGSTRLGDDGSMAAFVPAGRALVWHLTDEVGASVVKERYWVTFQPGEIRVCASCHGLNDTDQAGRGVPQNPPDALRDLLEHWLDR